MYRNFRFERQDSAHQCRLKESFKVVVAESERFCWCSCEKCSDIISQSIEVVLCCSVFVSVQWIRNRQASHYTNSKFRISKFKIIQSISKFLHEYPTFETCIQTFNLEIKIMFCIWNKNSSVCLSCGVISAYPSILQTHFSQHNIYTFYVDNT